MTLLSPSVSRISRYFRHPCSCTDIAALLRQLDGRVKREDLVHVSFENDGKKKPWFVAIDRARRSVVLSVRGSLSAVDVVTDLCFADPTQNKVASESLELYVKEFDLPEKVARNGTVHYGILCSALSIVREIRDGNVLQNAFEKVKHILDTTIDDDERQTLLEEKGEMNSSFQLVILGHSLGAGIATIVSILLRSSYPEIECIAFSPPGGLMSPSLCEYTKAFVRSIVIGDDIVSRISMRNFDRLRDQVVRYGCRSSERKFLIPFKTKFREFSLGEMRKGTYLLTQISRIIYDEQQTQVASTFLIPMKQL